MAKQGVKAATPRLRFPEFRGASAWTVGNLASTASFVNDKIAVVKLGLDNYVSTENLVPDYGDITIATKLPDIGSVTHFKRDDVLISNIRPYLKKVWRADRDGGASNDVIVIRRKSAISDAFLSLILRNDAFIAYVMESAKGVKMPRGDIDAMRGYQVAYPEPAEQQEIADCLTSLDEVIAAQWRKVEALRAHKRGLMQQLFPREGETCPRLRFPEFRDAPEWQQKTLGEIANVKASGDLDSSLFSETRSGDFLHPVYSNAVERNGLYGYYSSPQYPRDSVTITARGTLGIAFFRDHEFMGIGRLLVVNDLMDVHPRFLTECWNHLAVISNEVTSIPQLTAVAARATKLPIPSIEEQLRIADCLSSLDTQITAESNQLAALKIHKQGLMQQLFPAPEAASA